jgi:flagellin-like hook-associated protein FlgL
MNSIFTSKNEGEKMNIQGSQLAKLLNNQMKRTQSNLEKTIGKIATGQRVRSAANDASGLAISQKMAALARGSHQAIRNVQDASSLVQVADGAMQEMTDIMQRIRELTVKASNGTNSEENLGASPLSAADTMIIQNEVDELKKELNEIVHNTEFNQKKLLTNTEYGEFIYEDRTASKVISLSEFPKVRPVDYEINNVGANTLYQTTITKDENYEISQSVYTSYSMPESYTSTTVMDHLPKWSSDGSAIVFTSSRDDQQYIVPADGSVDSVVDTGTPIAGQQTVSSNNLMRLRGSGSYLFLETRSSTSSSWTAIRSYDYNSTNDYGIGYSFSPKVDGNGNTSFVYADDMGNIKKVDVNINTQTVGNTVNLISTNDVANFSELDNNVTLPSEPNLYEMNTENASLKVEKINDSGTRELTYWDGNGTAPLTGYYTVTDNKVTFYNEAAIGGEAVDDAQDYYRFSFISNGDGDDTFTKSIPSSAEVYNMHGEDGPRSLNILVGTRKVEKEDLLSVQPTDVENTNGVYVNEVTGKIEFYGDFRPAYDENIKIEYMSDLDGRNEAHTISLPTGIDTYNLNSNSDNRSLRVSIDGITIPYDGTKTDGYFYDESNGRISFYGKYRPDIPSDPTILMEYVSDRSTSNTSTDVYGIPLSGYNPEVYNLGDDTAPNSIRVYRNGTEEIQHDADNGFQYNTSTNTIELHGTSRPNIDDYYTIKMIATSSSTKQLDDKVEVPLLYSPETYRLSDLNIPSTFQVLVDGTEVSFDENKTNGYFYNSSTNTIEIYGDARPEAGDSSNPDVQVFYVYESPNVNVGNGSYDFQLNSSTLDYGVGSEADPKAMRVYYKGAEVPYDADNGFSYDPNSNQLSLHGTYRPDKDDGTGDYDIYSINADDLKVTVPENSYIYKVELNGQEIQKAQDASGNGYTYNGQTIEIVGNARPDITNTTSQINFNVLYFDSLEVELNESMPNEYFHNYCDHEVSEDLLGSEIDPTALTVTIDGNTLTPDQYSLRDGKIVLNQNKLTLSAGDHSFKVNYRVRQGVDYEPNSFTFQTGANAGQSLKVDIASFDNMLRDTNVICVRTHEDASKGLEVIDKALDFVLNELGNVGAVENRLDHIASNLSIVEENTLSSMSRIQDIDMAKEIMNLAKEQILSQAQQAMGAQLKQSQMQVLKLLQ